MGRQTNMEKRITFYRKPLLAMFGILFLLSHKAFDLVSPLSEDMREQKAIVIVTGEVTAIREGIVKLSIGTNAFYTVDMKVDSVEKGQGISKGDNLIFQYWQADKRPK